jgi:hypothetical protein
MTSEGNITRGDLTRLKREARLTDTPSPEEQAYQEGWDAAFAARDETRARAVKPAKIPRLAKTTRPEPAHGLHETLRLARVLAGYPPKAPKKRRRRW